jgi:hypothetical protein
MADETLGDFVINYLLFGLLLFGLIGSTLYLISMNNEEAISPEYFSTLNKTKNNIGISFVSSSATADSILNSTSYTDPEASYLGSKDQVASAYNIMGTGKGMWAQSKLMLNVLFSSNPEIIWIFGAFIVFSAVLLIYKFVRTGS